MDADTRAVAEGLNAALAESGLTQAAFAAALGTSASRFSTYRAGKTAPSATFYLRAQRIAASLRAARERGWMTPQRAIAAISAALDEGDEIWAYKMSLQSRDHLRELLSMEPGISGAWEAAPASTGHAEWDTLLAALAAHEFEAAGYERPTWTEGAPLEQEWLLDSPLFDAEQIRQHTPGWLAERGIFIAERDLATA